MNKMQYFYFTKWNMPFFVCSKQATQQIKNVLLKQPDMISLINRYRLVYQKLQIILSQKYHQVPKINMQLKRQSYIVEIIIYWKSMARLIKTKEIKNLIKEQYGLQVDKVIELPGFWNQNYKIVCGDENFVLKVYPNETTDGEGSFLEFVKAMIDSMVQANQCSQGICPNPVQLMDGSFYKQIKSKKKLLFIMMISFVEGKPIIDCDLTKKLSESLGKKLAEFDKHMMNFESPTIEARKLQWNIQNIQIWAPRIEYITQASQRQTVGYFIMQYEQKIVPLSKTLRKSIIHNDANQNNVFVVGEQVNSLIDFGDICYSFLINQLAVAIVHNFYREEDPLAECEAFIKAYHQVLPLQTLQIKCLFYLIAARLCLCICNTAYNLTIEPQNDHVDQANAYQWSMLQKLRQTNADQFQQRLLVILGFEKEQNMAEK